MAKVNNVWENLSIFIQQNVSNCCLSPILCSYRRSSLNKRIVWKLKMQQTVTLKENSILHCSYSISWTRYEHTRLVEKKCGNTKNILRMFGMKLDKRTYTVPKLIIITNKLILIYAVWMFFYLVSYQAFAKYF